MKALFIVTGSIASCETHKLIGSLKKEGVSSSVILTKNGEKFLTPLSISCFADEVITDSMYFSGGMQHLYAAKLADVIVVFPASADFLAKTAAGIMDELATSVIPASTTHTIFFPAMNPTMWSNPITRRNVETIKTLLSSTVVDPIEGECACGDFGHGRIPYTKDACRIIVDYLKSKSTI